MGAAEGECVATLEHAGRVVGVAAAPSGAWVAGLSWGIPAGALVMMEPKTPASL